MSRLSVAVLVKTRLAERAVAITVAARLPLPGFHGALRSFAAGLMLASVLVIGLCERASWAQTDVDFINPYDELESSIWCLSDEERQQLSKLYHDAEQASWRMNDAQGKYEQAQRELEKAAEKANETSESADKAKKAAAATAKKIAQSKEFDARYIRNEAERAYNKALQAYRAALAAAKAKAKACPRPPTPAESFYFFIQTLKNSGQLQLAERLAEAGQQTFGVQGQGGPARGRHRGRL
jgi:hypothetical protein